jgi:hypothetical protein
MAAVVLANCEMEGHARFRQRKMRGAAWCLLSHLLVLLLDLLAHCVDLLVE